MTEREQAVHVLISVLEKGQYLKEALAETAGKAGMPVYGHGYLWKVTKGVTERAIELDATVNAFAAKKIKRMHPAVRSILRLGCYELLYMDTIPSSASVNECVRLTRSLRQPKASGLVNALLRRISIEGQPKEITEGWNLSTRYSMPEWIVKSWTECFGFQKTEAILQAFLQEYPLSVRVRTGKITVDALMERFGRHGIKCHVIEGLPDGISILSHGTLTGLPGFSEGLFYVQDPASMSVCHFAGIHEGEKVLDVCASPGGKAFHAAELVGRDGHVEARDVSEVKIDRLLENQRRGGYENVTVKVWDARKPDEASIERYDVVLADVPCSGLGVLGRKPEIKYRLRKEDIDRLCRLAGSILEQVWTYVKPGGRFVFSTCTISRAENEEQIQTFIHRHPGFSVIRQKQFLPGELQSGNDGFYICVMKRNE